MILDYQGIKIHSVELIEEVEEVVKPEATLLQILNIYNEDDLDQSLVQLFSEESILKHHKKHHNKKHKHHHKKHHHHKKEKFIDD